MQLINEDLARSHPGRDRWRGRKGAPGGHVSREAELGLSARLAVARMLFGGGTLR